MTMSYNVYLHRIQIICASNTWENDLAQMAPGDREWLELNSVYINVLEKMFLQPAEPSAS